MEDLASTLWIVEKRFDIMSQFFKFSIPASAQYV